MITLKCWNWTEDVSVVHFPSKCVFKLLSLFNAAMRPAKGLLVRSPTLNWHCLYIIFNFWNIFDSMQKHNLSSRDGSDERECTEVVLPGLGYIWHIFDNHHQYKTAMVANTIIMMFCTESYESTMPPPNPVNESTPLEVLFNLDITG